MTRERPQSRASRGTRCSRWQRRRPRRRSRPGSRSTWSGALGPDGYGVFALALGIGTALTIIADAGVTPSAARFIAERREDRVAVARIVVNATTLKTAAALPLGAALAALAGPIADAYGNGDLEAPLRLMAVALAAKRMFTF